MWPRVVEVPQMLVTEWATEVPLIQCVDLLRTSLKRMMLACRTWQRPRSKTMKELVRTTEKKET